MTKRPRSLSGRKVEKALLRLGFRFDRQTGSHRILVRDRPLATVPVPDHPEIGPGLLGAIVKQAGLTMDEFLAAL
ncbi:MAG: type II toxin-antitoxin system HicA family toxin [Candidatus Thermoplasmatota archaeon]